MPARFHRAPRDLESLYTLYRPQSVVKRSHGIDGVQFSFFLLYSSLRHGTIAITPWPALVSRLTFSLAHTAGVGLAGSTACAWRLSAVGYLSLSLLAGGRNGPEASAWCGTTVRSRFFLSCMVDSRSGSAAYACLRAAVSSRHFCLTMDIRCGSEAFSWRRASVCSLSRYLSRRRAFVDPNLLYNVGWLLYSLSFLPWLAFPGGCAAA